MKSERVGKRHTLNKGENKKKKEFGLLFFCFTKTCHVFVHPISPCLRLLEINSESLKNIGKHFSCVHIHQRCVRCIRAFFYFLSARFLLSVRAMCACVHSLREKINTIVSFSLSLSQAKSHLNPPSFFFLSAIT